MPKEVSVLKLNKKTEAQIWSMDNALTITGIMLDDILWLIELHKTKGHLDKDALVKEIYNLAKSAEKTVTRGKRGRDRLYEAIKKARSKAEIDRFNIDKDKLAE